MSALPERIRGADDAAAYVRRLVTGAVPTGLLVVGLDREQRLCGVAVNPRHAALTWVKTWEVANLAAELDAHALVFGLVRDGPGRAPTQHEIESFTALERRARRVQVLLLDCLIVHDHRWWSLRELGAPSLPRGSRSGVGTRPRKSRPPWSDL